MTRVLCVGEAMVELAPVEGGLYRRGFAGDTFNTAWHMAHLLGPYAPVGMLTQVGRDALSDQFVAEMAQDGLDVRAVSRSGDRTMGLYMIALDGVERSFHYWRGQSAAKALADDPARLAADLNGADLIHLSGITVAILSVEARERMLAALRTAQARGARLSFDPNVRPALWSGPEATRAALLPFLAAADILLPSFDDEAALWSDANPATTVRRLAGRDGGEIVVKDGASAVHLDDGTACHVLETPPVAGIRDTTGAGDAFNAGYLAARVAGRPCVEAVRIGQRVAAIVLTTAGALAARDSIGLDILQD
ncbi:sugar kinase [Pontivivens insulae]|uniref:2-dehydro-3-deoxygluconokinase n=1 Tax=Pontivivens insulae TaxID=1639689 RepID=A0A2R8AE58_9RHOB|nr:sugar kinase [Pontivivens insulae]RED14421.1 2-keto-3-deoxygluconate kinase [Pontivivens insulae]SPF30499.1 2-dehydro-3-deoxygluconokinase [Pontivivens insulae]